MDQFSAFVLDTLTNIPPVLQIISIFIFSYTEGLPVIGSILPGGTIALLAGSLSAKGILNPFTAFIVIAIGSFLGDMSGFFLGKKFKNHKFIKSITSHEKHQNSWDLFDRHIAIVAIFGKLIPVVRSTPSIFAAARGIKTRKYIMYSFIGSLLWAFVGVFTGNTLTKYLGDNAVSIILLVLVSSVLVVISRSYFKKYIKNRKKH